MTTWLSPSDLTAWATLVGSKGLSAPGLPVATLQKVQARVQTSPMIIMVACFFDQHSPILGQPASSHTVESDSERMISRVSLYPAEVGALTLIQSGFFGWGALSGRWAFSGWRSGSLMSSPLGGSR